MYNDLFGKLFEYHGRGPEKYDCYGLMLEIYKRNGIDLPDWGSEEDLEERDRKILFYQEQFETVYKPQKLDIVLFAAFGHWHMGVMVDNFQFIHILEKSFVTIERIDSFIWKKKIRRFCRWKN